jgi:hypothetical protein
MPLSRIEIRRRATAFAKEWGDAADEHAEAKSFWDGFFQVFGLNRKRVATFEHHVKKLSGADGFVDLFWPGKLVVEHKSKGRSLDRAFDQAIDYLHGLHEHELPRYIIASDFARIRVHDLETKESTTIALAELPKRIELFDFISGWTAPKPLEQDPVNRKAAELMAQLHDELKASGYTGHALEVYLVRLLFCLFADDTGIFEQQVFYDFIEGHTKEDGSDVGQQLAWLFQLLNTPDEQRSRNLDDRWKDFHYINGKLFAETLPIATWDGRMRATLLECAALDWTNISPAIFGAMFQGVMDPRQRRDLGAHYTSEQNILKLIKPLFLDALWDEFNRAKGSKAQLEKFHQKLAGLRFLDPACGCGNFLVITYRELRRLELEVLKVKLKGQQVTNVQHFVNLDVDRFYGIEIEEFPAQIAQVALWLTDHQMNMEVSQAFGDYMVRIPLRQSATIAHANALRLDWQSLLTAVTPEAGRPKVVGPGHPESHPSTSNPVLGETPARARAAALGRSDAQPRYDYILGNPPFIGSKLMTANMRADIERVFTGVKGAGTLDFVCGWYGLAAQYMKAHGAKQTTCAFVSTNSIVQGEQVGNLWGHLLAQGIKIHFAHQTFRWNNEAKGVAAVHCVIIGFADHDAPRKRLFMYGEDLRTATEQAATNISPYLVEGGDTVLTSRSKPICPVPEIVFGSMPNDGGHLLIEHDVFFGPHGDELDFPNLTKVFIGAHDMLNGGQRWCLWLENAPPSELQRRPFIMKRVEQVRAYRLASSRESTRKLAATPSLFGEIRQPREGFLIVIPRHSSENRDYIPMIFESSKFSIVGDSCLFVPNADHYHFGVLHSAMHNAWVQAVAGRIKSDLRYSNKVVYNNFPWPESPSARDKELVNTAAQTMLHLRSQLMSSDKNINSMGPQTLAALYDPLTMPPDLVRAHAALDKAVDKCYRAQPFETDAKRVEYLFGLYEKYTAGLLAGAKAKASTGRRKNSKMNKQ